jgi:pathogenesis-related protein 1
MWIDEKNKYNIIADTCEGLPLWDNFDPCGQYTQLVWAETTRMGCYQNFCPAGTIFPDVPGWYLVCHYSPHGNYYGDKPYVAASATYTAATMRDPMAMTPVLTLVA